MLSVKAGLRAKEIAHISWSMVTNSEGDIKDHITLHNHASKGKSGGGVIWLNDDLKQILKEYQQSIRIMTPSHPIIKSERSKRVSPQVIVNMFASWYRKLGYEGCSSHSGRRTFITTLAKKISSVDGSLRDVQMLARHASLQMTQRYIEADINAQKKVVNMV